MLLPPQSHSSSKYASRNASMNSLSSDDYSSRNTSSMEGFQRRSSSTGSSEVEPTRFKPSQSLKSLGRKLFTRSSSNNLSPAPIIASRSHSASSASTSHSPPSTPTTLPVWLPNGTKDFLSDLPPISVTSTGQPLQSLGRRLEEISPRTVASPTFSNLPLSPAKSSAPLRSPPTIEETDSDFLRAVLNFGDGNDQDATPVSSSPRGGRAAPLPVRSSSLMQIAPKRRGDGKLVITEAAAKELTTSPTRHFAKLRPGLFGRDPDDSDDEYGEDDAAPSPTTTVIPSLTAPYPSSFAKSKPRSNSPAGLDTPSKRALYTCTLLKVHAQLAATLSSSSTLPALSSYLKANSDLRFPRSINAPAALDKHPSTYGFARDLRVALSRTQLMKRLKRDRLPLEQDVEISWFQRKYGTDEIGMEQIVKAMAQRQVSPEALARPPMDGGGGMVVWAKRPDFLRRYESISTGDDFVLGETGSNVRAQPIQYSPRVRALAGLISQEEERKRNTLVPVKFRPREGKRASRVVASDPGMRPERKREGSTKAPPPWIKSRLPLSPQASSRHLSLPQRQTLSTQASSPHLPSPSQYLSPQPTQHLSPQPSQYHFSSDEEENPLARLQNHRASRSAEKERIRRLEEGITVLKLRERKQAEARKAEQNKKLLAEARERRGKTKQSELLSAPNYGAGSQVQRGGRGQGLYALQEGVGSRMSIRPHQQQGLYAVPEGSGSRASMMPHQQGLYAVPEGAGSRANMMPHQAGLSHQQGFYAAPEIAGSRMSMMPPHYGSMRTLPSTPMLSQGDYGSMPSRVSSRRAPPAPLVSLYGHVFPTLASQRASGWQ